MRKELINILLVDDDPVDRQLTKMNLAKPRQPVKFAVETAGSLAECKERLNNNSFDLVLLDLGLPDSHGLATVDSICEFCPYTPIVVLTSLADEEAGVEAIKRGASDYLVKSKSFKDLLVRTIRYALERKQAEKALHQSQELYRTLVENIHLGITLIDTNHRIVMTNVAHGNLFNKPSSEFVGKYCFKELEKRDAICSHCPGTRAMATGRPAEVETEGVRDDGSRFSVRIQAFPVSGADGVIKGFIEVVEDITERKKAEKALEHLNEELEATVKQLTLSNRELQDFAHIVAHDLKTPLRAITTLTHWISKDYSDKFDKQGRKQLRLLMQRAERLNNFIDSILRCSEISHTRQKTEEVNLNTLLAELIREIVPPENIEITVENEMPTVICEKNRMLQIFQNLLSNAVKYMDKPKGHIKVGCVEEDGFWKFNISDNGPGIEEKYFEKIFKMFQTLSPRDEVEATGIGLSVVKKIVETYGGKIRVESDVGKGSSFFFTVPKQEKGVVNARLQADTAG